MSHENKEIATKRIVHASRHRYLICPSCRQTEFSLVMSTDSLFTGLELVTTGSLAYLLGLATPCAAPPPKSQFVAI